MRRHSLSIAALIASVLAVGFSAFVLVFTLTRPTTSARIKDHTIRLVDLSNDVVNARIRGPRGSRGLPGKSGQRGPRGKPGTEGPS